MIKRILIVCGIVLLLGMVQKPAMANWQSKGGIETITKGQVVIGDLFFNGDRLEVNGDIQGDLLVFANDVIINGRVTGSILGIVSDKLTINGVVERDVRVMGTDILVNGSINRSLAVAAVKLYLAPESIVKQGVLGFIGNQIALAGQVEQLVEINSPQNTKISGRIHGDLILHGASPAWTAPVTVTGRVLDYTDSETKPQSVKGVSVGSYETRTEEVNMDLIRLIFYLSIVWFIGSVLLTLVFYRLFPITAWTMSEPSAPYFRRSLFIGILGLVATPLVIYILFLTRVGLPIAIFLSLIYAMLLLFAGIPVNIWFGRVVFRSKLHPVLTIVLGSLLILGLNFVPGVGLLVEVLGLGMIVSNIRLQVRDKQGFDQRA